MTVETRAKARPLFDPPIARQAVIDSFGKLNPRNQIRNPVMFIVEIGAALTTVLAVSALLGQGEPAWVALNARETAERAAELSRQSAGFIIAISLWLWFTVLFANFAEAMAEVSLPPNSGGNGCPLYSTKGSSGNGRNEAKIRCSF